MAPVGWLCGGFTLTSILSQDGRGGGRDKRDIIAAMGTLREFLRDTRSRLEEAGVLEPRLESEVMLTDVLGVPRHRLYAYQDDAIPEEAIASLEGVVERRLRREPLAYILGHREFYGVDLTVGPGVMVPRPETEMLVERSLLVCLERMDRPGLAVADVGTGSGGIAVSLAMHLPGVALYATDISAEALAVARVNVDKFGLGQRVTLLEGDMLEPLGGRVDVIVANLPYIPTARLEELQPELAWEPRGALDGGEDGMALLRRLMGQAAGKLAADGVMLLEIDQGQGEPLRRLSARLFPGASTSVEEDLAGLERLFVLECGGGERGD